MKWFCSIWSQRRESLLEYKLSLQNKADEEETLFFFFGRWDDEEEGFAWGSRVTQDDHPDDVVFSGEDGS
jgi:hypothetical protein